MPSRRRTGSVLAPAFLTSASILQRMLRSRSVVVSVTTFFSACSNTLERIGNVLRMFIDISLHKPIHRW